MAHQAHSGTPSPSRYDEPQSSNGAGNKRKSEDPGNSAQSRKRNRYISIACNECKRRKIKVRRGSNLETCCAELDPYKALRCNGETPCQRCGNLSLECLYAPNCTGCSTSIKDSEEFQQMKQHVQSLQEQVDSLYTTLSNLPDRNDAYTSIEPTFSPNSSRSLSMSAQQQMPSRTLPPLRKNIPRFHGPTSSAYGFDVAKSSLQTMGINQDPMIEDGGAIEDIAPTPAPVLGEREPAHPGKDPLWSITQADAVGAAHVYEETCGLMYPLFDIECVVKHLELLYSFVEAALRTGYTQLQLPGAQAMEDDDTNIAKLVIAIGLICEGHGESETAQAIYDSMQGTISATIIGATDLKGLKLIVLCATFNFQRDREGRAWRMIGIAARLCYELGLHRRDSLVKTFTNEAEYQNAVRVFWVVYALDRRWSFGTGMPFALQDADIDPLLPEPDDSNLYLKHVTKYNKITSKVWSYNLQFDASNENKRDEIGFLDYQILQWYQQVPDSLRFNQRDLMRENEIPSRGLRKLRFLLFLRANLARIQIYRPILHSATSIMENRHYAQKVVDVAKETISLVIKVNQTSDLYRTQQVVFNYFVVQALAVIFLAVSHAPAEFFRQTREEFYGALDLIRGFSTKSYISKRLWSTIRDLRGLGEKIGAMSRNGADDPHSSAAVAMAGLAGHSINDLSTYGLGSRRNMAELAVSPTDGQQISNELINLFELAGGYGDRGNTPGSQTYNMYGASNGELQGGEGVSALFGNEQEFSKILGELF